MGAMDFAIDSDGSQPSLSELVEKGIEVLDNENGFFMMCEGGKVDYAGHANDAATSVRSVIALDKAVPLWGEVQAVTLAVIGLCAAGAVCVSPDRLKRLWEIPRLRILLIFSGAGVATACLQQLIYPGPAEYICTSFFFFLLPVAGMIFSSELKSHPCC